MGQKPAKKREEFPTEWRELSLGRKVFIVVIVLAMVLMLLKSTQIPIVRDVPTGL